VKAREYRRIACEEGFLSPGVLAANARASTASLPLITADGPAAFLARPLVDLGEERIAAMDADGIDMQLLLLSSPGVQVFDAATASSLAGEANDYASQACERHPARFAALAALAPQDPAAAVRELERALKLPGIKGAMVNSHTFGEYLDAPKYLPLFEALQALDAPLYIHPREPAGAMAAIMAGPVVGGAAWAYGVEVGTHVLRLIQCGLFDRFPKLRLVIGHMGEALPFMLARCEQTLGAEAPNFLCRSITQTILDQVWITTSGFFSLAPFMAALLTFGADRILFSVDYPYASNREARDFLDRLPVAPADRQKIAHGNADKLLKL